MVDMSLMQKSNGATKRRIKASQQRIPYPQPPGTTHGSIPSRHQQESAAAQRARESLKINNRIFKGYINTELIRCCALLTTSEYERALGHVENASFLAEEQNFSMRLVNVICIEDCVLWGCKGGRRRGLRW
ncbi:uncharacterized protein EAF02_002160 [Botrytis sinoallii]|uniref:uncharacterized protein n=1 Tax=Botrytis sinoallii TaxID=1463999 RepID=UPI00190023C0|nr:uncharacterized protein EAF02_002160 [Botrytis sinoallii]KAF7889745.1 hypothetical protein EAF02_002160 [Botrytis sinoallii]